MDGLRLALLIIGALVVLGIYLWDIFLRTTRLVPTRRDVGDNFTAEDGDALREFLFSRDNGAPQRSASGAPFPAPVRASPPSQPVQSHVPAEHLVLFIRAQPESMFSGQAVSQAAGQAGMHLSVKGIFHHFGESSGDTSPWFSMADMYEPGTFTTESLSGNKIKGLAMIFYPSQTHSAKSAKHFEKFLSGTLLLAKALDGLLYYDQHTPLSREHIDTLCARYLSRARS